MSGSVFREALGTLWGYVLVLSWLAGIPLGLYMLSVALSGDPPVFDAWLWGVGGVASLFQSVRFLLGGGSRRRQG